MASTSFFPPRIVSAYLRREFLRAFFLCLLLLWALFLLGDFLDRFDDFIRQDADPVSVARYFFFKAPRLMTEAVPAAALVGSLLSLSLLSRHKEIIALKACGLSMWQVALPVLLAAAAVSAGVWGWNEFVVPPAFHKARYVNETEIKKKPAKGVFDQRGFWYHGDHVFYHIEHFDSRANTLSGLTIYTLDGHFQIRSLTEAKRAVWRNGQWDCEDLQERFPTPEGARAPHSCGSLLRETPEDFSLVEVDAEEFSSRQLRLYVKELQRKGLDATAYKVDLHLKGAIPVAALAMTLLGLSLATPGARQLTIATALAFALVIGFGYWVLLALTVSLGHGGAVPPFFAAWSANGATFLLGMFFLLGAE